MNTKRNKNKKANKQPNPKPPQKEDTENMQEKIESEHSDRANIFSGIVTESEVPKKPKRNRGKKKKHDREDDVDKNEEKISEVVKMSDVKIETLDTDANIIEFIPKDTSEQVEHISDPTDETIKLGIVVSIAENIQKPDPFEQEGKHSKKKNKKNKQRHDSDRSDKSGEVISCTTAFQKLLDVTDQTPSNTLEVECKDLEAITIEDSQLLNVAEYENITDTTAEENIEIVASPETNVTAEENMEIVASPETEIPIEETQELKEIQKYDSKRKKHKKDKKHLPIADEFGVSIPSEAVKDARQIFNNKDLAAIIQDQGNTTTIQDTPQKGVTEVVSSDNIESISDNASKSENISQDQEISLNIQELTQKDDTVVVSQGDSQLEICKPDESPKPKAKIAKPVDKNRKGKQEIIDILMSGDIPTSESLILEKSSSELQTSNKQDTTFLLKEDIILNAPDFKETKLPSQQLVADIITFAAEKEEIKLDISPTHELLEPIKQPQFVKNEKGTQEFKEIEDTIEAFVSKDITEPNDTPVHNKPDKKKRKPLKLPIPTTVIPVPIKSLEEMTTELSKEGKEEIGNVESIFETLVPPDIEVKFTDEKLDEILESKLESNDNTEKTSSEITRHPEEKWIKPKKKGKKPLKIPSTPGIIDDPFSNLDKMPINIDESSKEDEVTTQQSPIDTLEISSVKADDSECSPCDVAPDIIYPRSTSQHNIDDNNNTVIREISLPDTLNLPTGLTTPLIQGSGETPIGTPIMLSSFQITEIENTTGNPDLKSKVIEVNQDMEELRLSIERSLAELTEMETCEEEAERKYEEQHTSVDDITVPEKVIETQEVIQISNKESSNTQLKTEDVPLNTKEVPKESEKCAPLATQEDDTDLEIPKDTIEDLPKPDEVQKPPAKTYCAEPPPICPARRDNKGKGKKKKGKQEAYQPTTVQSCTDTTKEKREEKTEQKTESKEQTKQETKQKDDEEIPNSKNIDTLNPNIDAEYDPIENFEDALTSSADDVNKTFEMILNEVTDLNQKELAAHKPDINIIAPKEDFRESNVPQPKNLLGHPDIPVSSNKDDFKKEKHKTLNTKQAKVKLKDANDIEFKKESKLSQTETKKKSRDFSLKNSNENGDFIYKYSFRKVFLQNSCHVCAKELSSVRVPCNFCNLLFYCSIKHKDEDWLQHQALCFAISTIVHLKDQKHIYAEAMNITGQNYRLLRMQMILSCEKVLKRRLVPWEQEALLYPRICADIRCREWRQSRLKDCEGCGQISYCANNLDHLPLSHQRWCKSYALYQKLVTHQQTKGRLEPKLPTKVMTGNYEIPEKINEVLASMYEEQIDNMNDIQYAALTQIATAPLTVAFSDQLYRKVAKPSTNGIFKKSSFVIHVLGAELQFEADVLNKWEVFFLHLRPDVNELVVVLISSNLNPGNLPLELLGKIRLCDNCIQNKRRVILSFQDKKSYQEYRTCDDFIYPDIVCAFNVSINRSSYNPKDLWPGIITSVMRLRSPFLITSHTPTELQRDLIRIKECGDVKVMVHPRSNTFASVRPDRNFITDDETPLLFKNQCFMVLCGV